MKFFALFSCLLAVAMASNSWTISELSEAIQNPSTDANLIPILEQALNELMLEAFSGNPVPVTSVSTGVQDFTLWTLNELSDAIQDPSTDAALLPYLEHALNNMMVAIMSGQQMESIIVATPVGLLPVEVVVPVIPAPVDTPIIEETPSAASSPLVQIIVNVNAQNAGSAPVPVVIPEPVIVAPEIVPEPVIVAPGIVPEPVIIAPPVLPNPVDVIAITPPEVNPVDVIAINPEIAVNPIDVVAIAAPEVNPVDILAPVPVVAPVGAVGVVGPIV